MLVQGQYWMLFTCTTCMLLDLCMYQCILTSVGGKCTVLVTLTW